MNANDDYDVIVGVEDDEEACNDTNLLIEAEKPAAKKSYLVESNERSSEQSVDMLMKVLQGSCHGFHTAN